MAFAMKAISPYSDPATVVRCGMPITSFLCPRCRRRCDFHMTRKADASYSIEGLEGDKAICAIGTPEAAEDCMLRMDRFCLECRMDMLDRHEAPISKIAKEAYLVLLESEKAECPAFLTLWALMKMKWTPEAFGKPESVIQRAEIEPSSGRGHEGRTCHGYSISNAAPA